MAGCRGVFGAASGAGIAIGAYFAFYGAATNLLVRHSGLPTGQVAFVAGAAAAAGGSVVKVPLAVCIRCPPPPSPAWQNRICAAVGPPAPLPAGVAFEGTKWVTCCGSS